MCYFAFLVVVGSLQEWGANRNLQTQLLLNLITNIGLSVYLSINWLRSKFQSMYLPIALLVATIIPIFSNLIYLAEPVSRDLQPTIIRSWLLFPTLIVPLVLIAWQYGLRYVLVFTVLTALVELAVLVPLVGRLDIESLPILGSPLIRAFAYGTIGHIVAHLYATQEAQSRALYRANQQLIQHAEILEQLATSRERNRLARELHDTLAHTLSGQAVNLEAVKLILPAGQTEAQTMLDQALENTRQGLRDTRRALKDLRSLPLEDLGLAISVSNLARSAAARGGFALDLDVPPTLPELPAPVEHTIFRIAQESLENIILHASAHHVGLRLGCKDGRLHLIIADDGKGIDANLEDQQGRYGLQGMRERASECRGLLEITSQPSQGTTIHFSIEAPDD